MLTTEGSIIFAIFVNSFGSAAAEGMTSGVASGATAWPFAAVAVVVTSVPTRTTRAVEKTTKVEESSFCCRMFASSFMR